MKREMESDIQPEGTPNQEQPAKPLTVMTTENENKEEVKFVWHLAMIGSMLLALGLYVAMAFLSSMTSSTISYYYGSSFQYASNSIGADTATVTTLQGAQPTMDGATVAKAVGFSWLAWKLSNCIYVLDIISVLSWQRKLIGGLVMVFTMLAIDILLTLFLTQIYAQWMFVVATMVVISILGQTLYIKIENKPLWHHILRDTTIPYLCYAVITIIFWMALPKLWNVLEALNTNGSTVTGAITFIYIYPLIDTALVALVMATNWGVSPQSKDFTTQIYSLLQGYRVGIILLCAYFEVQFYYILGFTILRNIFISYVINFHTVGSFQVSNACWIIAYFINYLFSFNPLLGLNKTIISVNYRNYMTTNTNTYLYGWNFPNYPSGTAYNDAATQGTSNINVSLSGAVIFFSAIIIWVGDAFSQRYVLKKIDWKYWIYCLFGVGLFFLGLSSALCIDTLKNAII